MKKSLLITLEFPPQIGGVANYLSHLSVGLPKEQIVVLAPENKDADSFDRSQEYKIYRKKLFFCFFWPKWLSIFFPVLSIIKKEKIEMIQVSHLLPVGYIAYGFKKLLKIPYLVYLHGLDIKFAQKSKWKTFWAKKILNNAEHIVANSEFTKNEAVKLGIDKDKVKVIYPCANVLPQKHKNTKTQKQLVERYNLQNKKIILTVGRLVERKGQDMVIRAMFEIVKKVPDAIYLIVGNGPQSAKLKASAFAEASADKQSMGIKDKVIFIEKVTDEELPAYYELCDLFIMPAREIKGDVEGFGIVYLEAGSFGKPVVAGRSGGVSEAVIDGETGLLVDPENIKEIAEAVIRLFQDEELAHRLGQAGKERVEKEFQWEKQTEILLAILN